MKFVSFLFNAVQQNKNCGKNDAWSQFELKAGEIRVLVG